MAHIDLSEKEKTRDDLTMFNENALRERLAKVPHFYPEFVDVCMDNVRWHQGFGELLMSFLNENDNATQSDVLLFLIENTPDDPENEYEES